MQLHRLRLLLVRLLALALVQAAHGDPPAKSRQPSISTEPARTDRYSDPLPAGVVARLGTVRLRHSACFAFAPDGKTLATAERQTIRLWELATGKELSRWPTRIDGIRFLLFSPDGRRLAALEALGLEAEILDLHRKQPQFHLRVPRRGGGYILRTARMAFSPDGKILYAGNDQTVHGWDATTGKEVSQVRHTKKKERCVNTIVLSEDGKTFATAGDLDRVIRLWDTPSGKLLHVLKGHNDSVLCAAFRRDGRLLATGGDDDTARLWDVRTGKEVRKLGGHRAQVVSVAFSPDGRTLASASNNTIGSTATGEQALRLWNLAAEKEPARVFSAPDVRSVDFSPDGKLLAWVCCAQTVRLLDRATGKEHNPFASHHGEVACVTFSPDGKRVATASRDHTIHLWDPQTGKPLRVLAGHTDGVNAVAFSPDGKQLVSASRDRTAALWDVATGRMRLLGEPRVGQGNEVHAVAFSPDGKVLATGGYSGLVYLWDVQTGKEIRRVKRESDGHLIAKALAFSADGKVLVCGGFHAVHWINPATGRLLRTREMGKWVTSLSFSPDGKTLAVGCNENLLLLETATWKERARFPGHWNESGSVAFSPDGRLLASGSHDMGGDMDKTIHVWELATGKEVGAFRGHERAVLSVAFSPDGKRLATASADATVLIWDLAAVSKEPRPKVVSPP